MKKVAFMSAVAVAMLVMGTLGGFLFNYLFYGKIATHPIWSQSALVKSMDNRLQIIRQTEKVVVQSSESIADIARTPAAAVVHVTAVGAQRAVVAEGSGIVVSGDGVIATTDRVVPPATTVYVTRADGSVTEATALYRDTYSGVVFVRIDAQNLSTIAFANSDDAQSGKRVISVTRDRTGALASFAAGGVMGVARDVSVAQPASDHLQGVMYMDFAEAVLAASAGAPVVDYQGNMVGLMTAHTVSAADNAEGDTDDHTVYYAIAANDIYESFAHYLRVGQSQPSQEVAADTMTLGVSYHTMTPLDAAIADEAVDYGARITAPLAATSRGARSGIRAGDIVTAVNDTSLDGKNTLARVLRTYQATDTVTLTVVRGTETMHVPIVK